MITYILSVLSIPYAGLPSATNSYALLVTNIYSFLRYHVLHVLMFFLVKYKYRKRYGIALKFTNKCYDNGTCISSLHTYKQKFTRVFLLMITVVDSRLLQLVQQQQISDCVKPSLSNVQVQATDLNSSTQIDGELMFTAGLIIHLMFDPFIQH